MKIFIGGADGTGKSTMGKSLSQKLDLPVFAFGDMVRKELAKLSRGRLTLEQLKAKPTPLNVRKALREYGQRMKAQYGEKYWVEVMEETLKLNQTDGYIIDDMRFKVELEFCKEQGGYSIYLEPEQEIDPAISTFEELSYLRENSDLVIEKVKNKSQEQLFEEIMNGVLKGILDPIQINI